MHRIVINTVNSTIPIRKRTDCNKLNYSSMGMRNYGTQIGLTRLSVSCDGISTNLVYQFARTRTRTRALILRFIDLFSEQHKETVKKLIDYLQISISSRKHTYRGSYSLSHGNARPRLYDGWTCAKCMTNAYN